MTGRPTTFTQELADSICERVAAGEYLAVICRDLGVGLRTVYDWRDTNPEFSASLAHAREDGEDALVVKTLEEIDEPAAMTMTQFGEKVDSGDVALRKLRLDARLKVLAVWNPKKWGQNARIEHTGKMTLESLVTGAAESAPE